MSPAAPLSPKSSLSPPPSPLRLKYQPHHRNWLPAPLTADPGLACQPPTFHPCSFRSSQLKGQFFGFHVDSKKMELVRGRRSLPRTCLVGMRMRYSINRAAAVNPPLVAHWSTSLTGWLCTDRVGCVRFA